MVWWLGLYASTAGGTGSSLVGELESGKISGIATPKIKLNFGDLFLAISPDVQFTSISAGSVHLYPDFQ